MVVVGRGGGVGCSGCSCGCGCVVLSGVERVCYEVKLCPIPDRTEGSEKEGACGRRKVYKEG